MFNITNLLNFNKSAINIPNFLKFRVIEQYDATYLKDFFSYFSITKFSEINLDLLNQYAKYNYDKAIQVNILLGLYGIEFIGKSAKKYSSNYQGKSYLLKNKIDNIEIYKIKLFKEKFKYLELKFLEYFEKIGLNNSCQINGINFGILLNKLNLHNIPIENFENDFNENYIYLYKFNLDDFYANMQEIDINNNKTVIKDDTLLKNTSLSTRTVNCLLASNIDTIEKLRKFDIYQLKDKRNVGQKTLDEIKSYLLSIGTEKNWASDSEMIENKKVMEDEEKQRLQTITKPLDEKIFNLNLEDLNLSQKLINKLNELKIITIGDFLNFNSNELSQFNLNSIYENLLIFNIHKGISYYPITLEMPENFFTVIPKIFNDSWVLKACNKYDLKNIGLLACEYLNLFTKDEEFAVQDDFFDKIKLIEDTLYKAGFDKLPLELSYCQKMELKKKTINEIIETDYIKILVNLVDEILTTINDKTNKNLLTKKEIDIIKERYGVKIPKKTLEEIAQMYSCTRERIRQIENKAIAKICKLSKNILLSINDEINLLLNYIGNFFIFSNNEYCEYQNIINKILEKFPKRCFDIDFENNVITTKNYPLDQISYCVLSELKNNFPNTFKIEQIDNIYKEKLNKELKNTDEIQMKNFTQIHDKFLYKFISDNLLCIDKNLYKLNLNEGRKDKQQRNEKIIYWVEKLYPNGIHLPIDDDKKLLEDLKPLYEKCPEVKELNIRSLSDRLIKYDKNMIWWGRGLYIHINNTHANMEVVDFAINEAIKKFDIGIYRFKPTIIFNEYKEKFIEANIPNEIALLGLIRYRNNPRIDSQRQELRDATNFNPDSNLLESFENFILKHPTGIKRADLLQELCGKRGWRPHQIEFLYSRSNFIFKDQDIFIHLNNLNINFNKINELIEIIKKELSNNSTDFIHLRKIRAEYPATWVSVINKNITPNFMGRLLSEQKDTGFIVDGYVYVKNNNLNEKNINLYNILDKYVEEKSSENKFVTLNEIIDFCRHQGLKDTKQPILDCIKNFCFEYSNTAYVHNSIIGYTNEFQEDMSALLSILSENNSKTPLFVMDEIISQYLEKMPTISDGYEWNEYLLKSALSKFEILDIFESSFIFKENAFGVEDIDDTAAYLLLKEYENGYCKYKEFDKLLAQYGITPYKKSHFYKNKLFFEGSSIKLVDNDTAVCVERFALEKYSNV